MKRFYCAFFMTLVLLLVSSTAVFSVSLSEENVAWLHENLLKPQVQPTFTVGVRENMLAPRGPDEQEPASVSYTKMTDAALQKEIETKPLKAGAYIELNQRYQQGKKYEQANEVLSLGLKRLFQALDKDGGNWQLGREVQKLYRSVHQQGKVRKMAVVFLKKNPNNVEALLDLAKIEIESTDFPGARSHIDKAYELSPGNVDVYISEILYQLKSGQVELGKTGLSASVIWPVSVDFFLRAAKEHPGMAVMRTAQHGLQIIQVFYSVILQNMTKLSSEQEFDFVVDERLKPALLESKSYFQQSPGDKEINPYFSQLCLLMAAIVENDKVTSGKTYQTLSLFEETDNDMYRLMLIADLSQAQVSQAIEHMRASIAKKDNIQDRLMLAYLYLGEKKADLSLQTLLEYNGQLSLEMLKNRLGYALFTKDLQKSVALYDEYKPITPLWRDPVFLYYALIVESLQGKSEEAKAILQMLPRESSYYSSGEKISHHLLGNQAGSL